MAALFLNELINVIEHVLLLIVHGVSVSVDEVLVGDVEGRFLVEFLDGHLGSIAGDGNCCGLLDFAEAALLVGYSLGGLLLSTIGQVR